MNARNSKISALILSKAVEMQLRRPDIGRCLQAIFLGLSTLSPDEQEAFLRMTIETSGNDTSPAGVEVVKILKSISQEIEREVTKEIKLPPAPPEVKPPPAEPKKEEAAKQHEHKDHDDHHGEPLKPPAYHRELVLLATTTLCCLSTIWWEPWTALIGILLATGFTFFLREDGPRDENPGQGVLGMRISNTAVMTLMVARALYSDNPLYKFIALAAMFFFLYKVFYFPRPKAPHKLKGKEEKEKTVLEKTKAELKAEAAAKAIQKAELRSHARALDNTLDTITAIRNLMIVATLALSIWVGIEVYWFAGVAVLALGGYIVYNLVKYHEHVFVEHTEWLNEISRRNSHH